MCDAEGSSIENYEEKKVLILEFLDENRIDGDENVEREDLYEKIQCYQTSHKKELFNIKQRSPDHFYSPDLAEVLARMEFYGLLLRDTRLIGNCNWDFFSLSKFGKEELNKPLTEKEVKEYES